MHHIVFYRNVSISRWISVPLHLDAHVSGDNIHSMYSFGIYALFGIFIKHAFQNITIWPHKKNALAYIHTSMIKRAVSKTTLLRTV